MSDDDKELRQQVSSYNTYIIPSKISLELPKLETLSLVRSFARTNHPGRENNIRMSAETITHIFVFSTVLCS